MLRGKRYKEQGREREERVKNDRGVKEQSRVKRSEDLVRVGGGRRVREQGGRASG